MSNGVEGKPELFTAEYRLGEYFKLLRQQAREEEFNEAKRALEFAAANSDKPVSEILESDAMNKIASEDMRFVLGNFITELHNQHILGEIEVGDYREEEQAPSEVHPQEGGGETETQRRMRDYLESLDERRKTNNADTVQNLFEFAYQNPTLPMEEIAHSEVADRIKSNNQLRQALRLIQDRRRELGIEETAPQEEKKIPPQREEKRERQEVKKRSHDNRPFDHASADMDTYEIEKVRSRLGIQNQGEELPSKTEKTISNTATSRKGHANAITGNNNKIEIHNHYYGERGRESEPTSSRNEKPNHNQSYLEIADYPTFAELAMSLSTPVEKKEEPLIKEKLLEENIEGAPFPLYAISGNEVGSENNPRLSNAESLSMNTVSVRPEMRKFVNTEGQIKSWDEMTESERRERYGDKYEARERLEKLQTVRGELALLERGLSAKDKKRLENVSSGKSDSYWDRVFIKEGSAKYYEALQEYEKLRAEYVGAHVLAAAKEAKKLAEERSEAFVPQKGLWEKCRKRWHWFSNTSILGNSLERTGPEKGGIIKQSFRRMQSIRSITGIGLLGAGVFAPGALFVSRALSGVGMTITSYDVMRNFAEAKENKALTLTQEKIDGMTLAEMDETLNRFYAQAKFAGKRFYKDEGEGKDKKRVSADSSFQMLYETYRQRLKGEHEIDVNEKMRTMDEAFNERVGKLESSERKRKVAAFIAGVGMAAGIPYIRQEVREHGGAAMHAIAETDFYKSVVEKLGGAEETVRTFFAAAEQGNIVDKKDLVHLSVPGAVPDEVLDKVSKMKIATVGPYEEGIHMTPIDSGPLSQETFAPTIEGTSEVTVEKGGNVWKALHGMLEKKQITKTQFNEIWKNSVYRTPGGNTIPISNLDLVQPGMTMRVVEAHGGVPAHVEFGGNLNHIGDTNDLAHAFRAANKPLPEWLHEKLEIEQGDPTHTPKPRMHMPPVTHEPEVGTTHIEAERAQHVAEEVAKGRAKIAKDLPAYEWGRERAVYDKNGKMIDWDIEEYNRPRDRFRFGREATRRVYRRGWEQRIARSVPYYYDTPHARLMETERRIRQAERVAYNIDRLVGVFQNKHHSHERGRFILDRLGSLRRAVRYADIINRDLGRI